MMVLTPLEKRISLKVLQDCKEALRDFKKSYGVPFISLSAFIQCLSYTLLITFTGNTLLKLKEFPNIDFINMQLIYFLIIPTSVFKEAS